MNIYVNSFVPRIMAWFRFAPFQVTLQTLSMLAADGEFTAIIPGVRRG
jgi:hypothetical protein